MKFSGGLSGNWCQYNTIVRGYNVDAIAVSIGGNHKKVNGNRLIGYLSDRWEGGQTYGTELSGLFRLSRKLKIPRNVRKLSG